jgi:hypothetical protein
MATLRKQIVALITDTPGLTDRELTDKLIGPAAGQQAVNQAAHALATAGQLTRHTRPDGKIGNYPGNASPTAETAPRSAGVAAGSGGDGGLTEDAVKRLLQAWLEAADWRVTVKWGRAQGIDIDAERNGRRWVVEAKRSRYLDPRRVNYFLAILGELLQRMHDPAARYSIALPDMKQFRGLWSRLPTLAKSRTQITALFVRATGEVEEVT